MDSEVIYSIFGVVGLSIIAYKTLRAGKPYKATQSKEDRRLEIISDYQLVLEKSLKEYDNDDEKRKAKKIMLLREFSEELHFNIFFDENDIKEIISELSGA